LNTADHENNWLIWQLADSAFPGGGFSHFSGLEAAWQHGEIRDTAELTSSLEASLWQTACGMIPFLRAAHGAPERVEEWSRRCDVFLTNHVTNCASRAQGRAFLNSALRIFGPSVAVAANSEACHFAPMFGAATRSLAVSASLAEELFFFQSLRGLVAAAIRIGIAGPTIRSMNLVRGLARVRFFQA
jgi:urease accessory protein